MTQTREPTADEAAALWQAKREYDRLNKTVFRTKLRGQFAPHETARAEPHIELINGAIQAGVRLPWVTLATLTGEEK